MKLDNKNIHDACGLVEEDDLEEATKFGMDMLAFVKKKKYLSLAANQVGYDKQVMVAVDDDGHDVYFNPEVKPIEINDGLIAIAPDSHVFPAIVPSFPKKKVLIEIYDKIEVDVFSVANDDRITFKAEGDLAKVWQITCAVLNGINMDSIVPCDYLTIHKQEKKKPNAKCPGCGRKNKKCKCPKKEEYECGDDWTSTAPVDNTNFNLGSYQF